MGKITTWNSRVENKDECVFIRGKFYHKERDCYLHNGVYYSPESRYYVLDHEKRERVFNIEGLLSYGVVGADGDRLVFGYFSKNIATNGQLFVSKEMAAKILNHIAISKNPQNNYLDIISRMSSSTDAYREAGMVAEQTVVKCMDVHSFLALGYLHNKKDDMIISLADAKACKIRTGDISAAVQYSFNLAYNSEVMMQEFSAAYHNTATKISAKERALAAVLGDKTFGIEYESWDGRIPTYLAAASGLIPLRDGSLRHDNVCGYEYASVIMAGAKGLSTIKDQCDHLRKFTTFNERCSMHIHIGNIPRTPENLVKLWKGFVAIQDDMFKMFPACLANTAVYKQKDYCNKLPKISDVNPSSIVSFLSGGKESFDRFGRKHPQDPGNQAKWNVNSRYYYCNFNNFYYTDRGTMELRISTPTYNHNKVAALLLIFSTLIDEALKGVYYSTVESLINSIPALSGDDKKWLLTYCDYRKRELNKYTATERGVLYHECISNDTETGNEHELY